MADQPQSIRLDQGGTPPSADLPIVRQELLTSEGSRAESVHTAPGTASPWHHHGDYDTYIYGVDGQIRVEYGPGGKQAVEVTSDSMGFVPKHVVHREVTSGEHGGHVFLVRVGTGQPVFNVEGPDPE